jgi:acetolactate synthase-1/2/3 large subunit
LDVSLVLAVLNNQILGFQRVAENARWGSHTEACYFEPVDHAAIAQACGAKGLAIDDPDAFLPAVREGFGRHGVTVLDIMTDPEAYPPITAFDGKFPP